MLRVLLIMQLPPPRHGATAVGQCIRESRVINEALACDYIRASTGFQTGGGVLKKVWALLRLYAAVLRKSSVPPYDLVYLTPCAWGLAFYKDYFLALLARRLSRTVVYHFHNKGIATNRYVPAFIKRHFFQRVSVILLSPALYFDIQSFVPRERVRFLPNGIDFESRLPEVPHERASVNILFLSNMIRNKGVFVLLEACRLLREDGLSFRCDFVGPWYEIKETEFQAHVAGHGLTQCVHHLGPKYGNDKAEVFARADIFAFPTFDECFPLVVLEAMSFGIPVVATGEGAIPEMIEDGKGGLVVPTRDAPALAGALQRLIKDADLRRAMGDFGREKYSRSYTKEKFEHQFVQTIREVASPPSTGASEPMRQVNEKKGDLCVDSPAG